MPIQASEERNQVVFFRNAMIAFLPKTSFRFIVNPTFLFTKRHRIGFCDIEIRVIEMLPRITGHGIDATLNGRYLLIIIHIEIKQQVPAKAIPCHPLTDVLESGIQGCLWRTCHIETATRTFRYVITEIQVGTHFFETMNLIVKLKISQTTTSGTMVIVLLQHRQRIDTCQGIRIVGSPSIVFYLGFPRPIAVVSATIVIDRLGRVKESSRTHRTAFGKTGLVNRSFHIHIHRQMVIEELGAEIERSRITVVMGSIQGTLFGIIPYRCTERKKSHLTSYTDVLVGCQARTEDFILPTGGLFGVLVDHGLCRIAQGRTQRILTNGG